MQHNDSASNSAQPAPVDSNVAVDSGDRSGALQSDAAAAAADPSSDVVIDVSIARSQPSKDDGGAAVGDDEDEDNGNENSAGEGEVRLVIKEDDAEEEEQDNGPGAQPSDDGSYSDADLEEGGLAMPVMSRQQSHEHAAPPAFSGGEAAGGEGAEAEYDYTASQLLQMGFAEDRVLLVLQRPGAREEGLEALVETLLALDASEPVAEHDTATITIENTDAQQAQEARERHRALFLGALQEIGGDEGDEEEGCEGAEGDKEIDNARMAMGPNRTAKAISRRNTRLAMGQVQRQISEEAARLVWACPRCTLINVLNSKQCEACEGPQPGDKDEDEQIVTASEDSVLSEVSVRVSAHASQDKEEEEEVDEYADWDGPTQPCLVCFDDIPEPLIVPAECGHLYCRDCWKGYLDVCITEGRVMSVRCMDPNCEREISDEEFTQRVDKPMRDKFEKFKRQVVLAMDPAVRFCQKPDCNGVMRGSRWRAHLTCPECTMELCWKCNQEWHRGTCASALRRKQRSEAGGRGRALLDHNVVNRLALGAHALVHDVKKCPKCNIPITRDGGCNHMTCSRCRYEFCWMCKKKYTDNHFALWNFYGCPGGQEGCLSCLGDDRVCCLNLSCGCGLAGMVKRLVVKLLLVALMLACIPFICLCGPVYLCCRACRN